MNIEEHFLSLSSEVEALKDRVYNLIGDAHWPSHGDWRESILRSVLRRHLPETIKVGRGFIVDQDRTSTEIDILLYNSDAPVLYRELDFVIVTPNAVRGIIEVKSTIWRGELRETVLTIARNRAMLVRGPHLLPYHRPAIGLFGYAVEGAEHNAPTWVLRELEAAADENADARIQQICFGSKYFVHYWHQRPGYWHLAGNYNRWHLYDLKGLGPGYFVNNVIEAMAVEYVVENRGVWFPEQGKEDYVVEVAPPLPHNEEA